MRGRIGSSEPVAEFQRDVFIYRAGVRLLLVHAQCGQHLEYDARFYF
jgi:hypothetical protein